MEEEEIKLQGRGIYFISIVIINTTLMYCCSEDVRQWY